MTSNNNLPFELKWKGHDSMRAQEEDCLKRTDWEAIRNIASRANSDKSCDLSPQYSVGGNSLSRLLEFEDGTRWVARVRMRTSTPESSERLRIEIDTTMLLKSENKAPVPRIFTFELDDANPARSAFVLLEFMPGNTAADEAGRCDSNLIPRQHRPNFYRTMAAAQVQIASVRLPQIGAVIRREDGSFTVGAIPGIGGPFDTAVSFIQAWASSMKIPYEDSYLRGVVPASVVDDVLEGNKQFPSRLAKLAASGKHFTQEGPFPIRHTDLYYTNVIVDKSYNVLGVIDWEGSYTVPWELVDSPIFVATLPRLINPPEQYDEAGQPLDEDEVESWANEEAYAEMVRDAERDAHADHRLSQILANRDARNLAGTIHRYSEAKVGLYGRALDYFESI